jgi:UDPglucose 6-dehydrogenase
MIKYAANCFLAMKLSYANALAELCEGLGADVADATEGMGCDRPIGQAFLSPGPGWGDSCLPKDTHALLQVADSVDFEFRLLRDHRHQRAPIPAHRRQDPRSRNRQAERSLTRSRIGLLGLTFKAGTDLRAPAPWPSPRCSARLGPSSSLTTRRCPRRPATHGDLEDRRGKTTPI